MFRVEGCGRCLSDCFSVNILKYLNSFYLRVIIYERGPIELPWTKLKYNKCIIYRPRVSVKEIKPVCYETRLKIKHKAEEIETSDILVGTPCINKEKAIVYVIQIDTYCLVNHYKDQKEHDSHR